VAQAQAPTSRQYHVSGVGLPSTLGSPTPIEGTALTSANHFNGTVDLLVIANQDTATHIVTVEDCSGTPFILFNGATIAASGTAGSTWFAYMPGTRFNGCVKWSSDSTLVMGTIVGTR
jgi:hypothetical protein